LYMKQFRREEQVARTGGNGRNVAALPAMI